MSTSTTSKRTGTTRKPRANKAQNNTVATTDNTTVLDATPMQNPVKSCLVALSLTQLNAKGEINTKVRFTANVNGDNEPQMDKIVAFLCDKLFGVFELQKSIAAKGGKNRLFNMTKSGAWVLDVDTKTTTDSEVIDFTLVSQLNFAFAQLGTDNPKEVLNDIVKGWLLINTAGEL